MDKPNYRIAIVAPVHIQPSDEWIKSLQSVAKNHSVIIVDDSDGKVSLPAEWDIYNYERQEEALGELYKDFEPFHKSSACRNFGHWIAYRQGFDIIISLDSDCIVPPDFIARHLEALMNNSYGWVNPIRNTDWFPRGFPYHERMRRTILNMGLWEHELDVNGRDRVKRGQPPESPMLDKTEIAHGILPLCGMNFAIWTYALPGFLFLPNLDIGELKIRRYDDIWGGYIFQKLMQKNHDMLTYGLPIVYHDTDIDASADAELEKDGIKFEEDFYQMVDLVIQSIDTKDYVRMFKDFAESPIWEGSAFEGYVPAFKLWAKLFE